tara:strand:+ start:2348 stop:4348 length:2001 start_codon:yes stop_codon:yes gene_type:complete
MDDLFNYSEKETIKNNAAKKINYSKKRLNDSEGYTARDIDILEGLDPVRKRPGMYIGGVDKSALHHLFNEILDNAIDEVISGHATNIDVLIEKNNTLVIEDNGRGIPIDPHPKSPDKSALEIILTTLHAGGKFNDRNYKTSGGLHGVGLSVVNALSEYLVVEVIRSKKKYSQDYSYGKPQTKLISHGKTSSSNGTKIAFQPDKSIFNENVYFDPNIIIDSLKMKAYLVAGTKITFKDNTTDIDNETIEICYPNGLIDFLDELKDGNELLSNCTFSGKSSLTNKDGYAEWAITWTNNEKTRFKSFCNTIPTIHGGTHETALKNALTRSLKNYAEMLGYKNAKVITSEDIFSCTNGILSIFINEPNFQGQTKEKLTSKIANTLTNDIISDHFDIWLSSNPDESGKLIDFFINIANSRIEKRQEKQLNRKSALRKLRLPGKLADCLEEKPGGTELFIVEGDSAGGSAKQARNKKSQAVLPLRGKILNVASSSSNKYYQNQQLKDLVQALGCGTKDNYSEDNLRYEKIIIMTDADVDGAHIAALLITFFFKEMPQLIVNKHLYIAMPPLYKLSAQNKLFYANDEHDRDAIIKKNFKPNVKVEISRFKGLGEMLPNQLRETTMNVKSRKLLQLTVEDNDFSDYEIFIDKLMGSKAETRYNLITEYADFTNH